MSPSEKKIVVIVGLDSCYKNNRKRIRSFQPKFSAIAPPKTGRNNCIREGDKKGISYGNRKY